jgi:protein NRD1
MQPSATPSNTSSILAALANMARQNATAAPAPASIPAQSSSQMSHVHNNPTQQVASLNPPFSFPPSAPPVNVPAATFAPLGQGQSNGPLTFPSNPPPMPFGALPPPPTQGAAINPVLQQQLLVIKTLSEQGVPQEQWPGILAALSAATGGNLSGVLPPPPPQISGANQIQNSWTPRPEESRDRNGYNDPLRSPPGRYRRRSRSPSPPRAWGARNSPTSTRRDGGYDTYGGGSPGRGREDRGRGHGNDYRQRSPQPRRVRSPSPPPRRDQGSGSTDRWIEYDPALAPDKIKGLFNFTAPINLR